MFHLVPLFIGRGTSTWLLSDGVGSHYINATKQTQTVALFRLIIVLVSLHVATLTVTFYFYICFRAFIELQDGIKIRRSCPGKKNCDKFC